MSSGLVITIVAAIALLSGAMVEHQASGVLQQFGIPDEVTKDAIWSSFSGMYIVSPGTARLNQSSPRDRGGIVARIAGFAREYASSAEFKKKYLEYRESLKPQPPAPPQSMAETKAQYKKDMQKSIRETEEAIKSMPADQRTMMRDVVASPR